jgi:hypothetical protein
MPMHLGSFKKTKTTSTSTKTHFLNLSCKTLHHFEGPNTKLAKIGFNLTSGFRANFFFFFFFLAKMTLNGNTDLYEVSKMQFLISKMS